MKKTVLGLVMASMVFSAGVFAQTVPPVQQAQPAGQQEWMALMKKQSDARKTFNEAQKAERDAFLKNYPELAARFEAQMKAAKERAEQRRAQMVKPGDVKK